MDCFVFVLFECFSRRFSRGYKNIVLILFILKEID